MFQFKSGLVAIEAQFLYFGLRRFVPRNIAGFKGVRQLKFSHPKLCDDGCETV